MINVIDYIRRRDNYNGVKCKPIIEFTFEEVKSVLPNFIIKGQVVELVNFCLNLRLKKETPKMMSFFVWVKDELEILIEREKNFLNSNPDNDLISAGIENLNKYGFEGIVKGLAKDITQEEKIKKLPYWQVFDRLLYDKEVNEIQKNYTEIQKNKR